MAVSQPETSSEESPEQPSNNPPMSVAHEVSHPETSSVVSEGQE